MKRDVRGTLRALLLIALLAATGAANSASAQEGHEGHDMGKPAAQPTPQPQPTPLKPATAPTTDAVPAPAQTGMPEARPTPEAQRPEPKPTGGHDMHDMGKPAAQPKTVEPKDSMPATEMGETDKTTGTTGAGAMETDSLMVMTGEQMDIRVGESRRNSIAMGQMGSGTSWQPATTPMYMWYKNAKGWLLFFHGDMKLGVNSQGGPRGVTKFESQNWFMPMAFRRVGPGTLQLRGMFSMEPFTFPRGGSGQLFQTGETFEGEPIIDAQHPHDLFMELSATYTLPLGERATWFAYFGYPGEPALGPTAFMHRWSASENPSAPLTHHLQDSTHITFGVLTTGFTYRWFKLEGSVFNGREPGENRYNFEAGPWNSRSARLSFAPNENWAMQVSYGFLRNPEALEPGDIRRLTASLSYNKRFARGNWASSFIWGRNHGSHGGAVFNLNGYTAESTLNFLDRNYLYTRLELVDKNELLREEDEELLGFTHAQHPVFRIGAYTFGYARDIWNTEKLSVALGSDFTFYSKPDVLDQLYGSHPTSYKFFIRIRPNKMTMSGHGGHTGHTANMTGEAER